MLIEARAKPRLRNIEGLWRKPVKGMRGATPKPGSMTQYIRDKGLLPSDEIDNIIESAPASLIAFADAVSEIPVERRPDAGQWVKLFDLRAGGRFDEPGVPPLLEHATLPAGCRPEDRA